MCARTVTWSAETITAVRAAIDERATTDTARDPRPPFNDLRAALRRQLEFSTTPGQSYPLTFDLNDQQIRDTAEVLNWAAAVFYGQSNRLDADPEQQAALRRQALLVSTARIDLVNQHRTPDPSVVQEDLERRWQPNHFQITRAVALLGCTPDADDNDMVVLVAIALPGKTHGIWELGQEVEPDMLGYWIANRRNSTALSRARSAAEAAALEVLGERPGQPSYAVIRADGHWAVFEGFNPADFDVSRCPECSTTTTLHDPSCTYAV